MKLLKSNFRINKILNPDYAMRFSNQIDDYDDIVYDTMGSQWMTLMKGDGLIIKWQIEKWIKDSK